MKSSLTVYHLHESGWDSHILQLQLTDSALLLSGSRQYHTLSGIPAYCIYPSEIRLEQIVKVEVRANTLMNGLKLFSTASHVHTVLLHLEYREARGGTHSYDFIPSDAQQWNNEWTGGDAAAIKDFAATIKHAIELWSKQEDAAGKIAASAHPLGDHPSTDKETATPTRMGITPLVSSRSTVSEFFRAQMCSPTACRSVTVWPISPVDSRRLLVVDDATSNILVDVPRESISSLKVRQHAVEPRTPTPGQIGLTLPMPFTPPRSPRVYQMCLEARLSGEKRVKQCLISDLASCHLDVPCEEGSDGGRHLLELERQIMATMKAQNGNPK